MSTYPIPELLKLWARGGKGWRLKSHPEATGGRVSTCVDTRCALSAQADIRL